jgi:hypothetical protein
MLAARRRTSGSMCTPGRSDSGAGATEAANAAGSQRARAAPRWLLSATRKTRRLRRWPNRVHPFGRVALGMAEPHRRTGLCDNWGGEYALPAARTGATTGALLCQPTNNRVAVEVDAAKSFPFDGEQAEAAGVSVRVDSSTAGKRGVFKARRHRNAPTLPLGRGGHGQGPTRTGGWTDTIPRSSASVFSAPRSAASIPLTLVSAAMVLPPPTVPSAMVLLVALAALLRCGSRALRMGNPRGQQRGEWNASQRPEHAAPGRRRNGLRHRIELVRDHARTSSLARGQHLHA